MFLYYNKGAGTIIRSSVDSVGHDRTCPSLDVREQPSRIMVLIHRNESLIHFQWDQKNAMPELDSLSFREVMSNNFCINTFLNDCIIFSNIGRFSFFIKYVAYFLAIPSNNLS